LAPLGPAGRFELPPAAGSLELQPVADRSDGHPPTRLTPSAVGPGAKIGRTGFGDGDYVRTILVNPATKIVVKVQPSAMTTHSID
jgi:hypothetical protein